MKRTAKTAFPDKYAAARARKRASGMRIVPYQSSALVPFGGASAAFTPSGKEIKAVDVPSTTYTFRVIPGSNNIVLLNGIQAGTGFWNRIGSRVEMKSIKIRGQIEHIGLATSPGSLRMVIVYDRQPSGAIPTGDVIFSSTDQTGTASISGNSEINLNNRDRFLIVREFVWYAPGTTDTTGNANLDMGNSITNSCMNEYVKLKGLATHYNSTANPVTIANIATGALYAAFVGSSFTSPGDVWQLHAGMRIRFEDK